MKVPLRPQRRHNISITSQFMEMNSLFQAALDKTDCSDDGKMTDALQSVGKWAIMVSSKYCPVIP